MDRWLKVIFVIVEKKLSSYHSLWRHRKTCKKDQEPRSIPTIQNKEDILGDILNKVTQRAEMDTKLKTMKEIAPQNIPMEVANNIEPKPLSDILGKKTSYANNIEPKPLEKKTSYAEQSDLESEESDSDESNAESVEFMPDNPEDLKKRFRQLFYKLHDNIDIYNKLVYILDEMKRINYLTKEECDLANKCVQEKMNI